MSSAEHYPGFNTRPREGRIRIVPLASPNALIGEYLSNTFASQTPVNSRLITTDDPNSALRVRVTPAGNPGVITVLNSPRADFPFLGVSMNQSEADFVPKSSAWGVLSVVTSPKSPNPKAATEGISKGAGWFVGGGGELVFHWDHTDGAVYILRHVVDVSDSAVTDIVNLGAYADRFYKSNPSNCVEVKLVLEPYDQMGR